MRLLAALAVLPSALSYTKSHSPRGVNPLSCDRRSAFGLVAATVALPAYADETEVDEEMLKRMQTSREAWAKKATRRGFAFEAGAGMPAKSVDDLAPTIKVTPAVSPANPVEPEP